MATSGSPERGEDPWVKVTEGVRDGGAGAEAPQSPGAQQKPHWASRKTGERATGPTPSSPRSPVPTDHPVSSLGPAAPR